MKKLSLYGLVFLITFSFGESLSLQKGWNLIGVESSLSLERLKTEIGSNNLLIIQGENKTYQKQYVDANQNFLNNFELFETGKGYWIKVENDISLEYVKTKYTKDENIPLRSGWNLINPLSDLNLTTIVSQLGIDNLEVIQGAKKSYQKRYIDNNQSFLNDFNSFEEPKGYWIKVNQNSTLLFPLLADSIPPAKPTLTTTPTSVFTESTSIEVNGEVGSSVFVNSVEVATIGSTGKVNLDLNTSGDDGAKSFEIILQDSANNSSQPLSFSIEKITITRADAIKLLRQASFVSNEGHISYIMNNGSEAWIDKQLNTVGDLDNSTDSKYGYLESLCRFLNKMDPTSYPASIISDPTNNFPETVGGLRSPIFSNSIWWQKVLENEDQLRQRVAYALSQILVVSKANNGLLLRGEGLAHYYDILVKHAFGNYRDLLKDVTMSPSMAKYLTFVRSSKENNVTGTAPDENYARELMQLFSIGLYELNLDGTKKIGENANPIPAYTQDDVSELSKVFTGWDLSSRIARGENGYYNTSYGSTSYYVHSFINPIEFTAQYHDYSAKSVLGQSIPAGLDGEADIDRVIDILMSNPNMAPHVSRHLIMRMVTSNPTPAYIERVASVFNNNGQGVKGDLKATVRAILIDPEARGLNDVTNLGKVEEFIIANTHFLSTFDVKPLPFFTFVSGANNIVFKNTYWFNHTLFYYPQAALAAESVFNFYSSEYVPTDSYFANNNLVSPELEIRTNDALMGFSGMFFPLFRHEKYDIKRYGDTIPEWTITTNPTSLQFMHFYFDLTNVYEYFEMQVDGDTNGDFINLNSTKLGHKAQMGTVGEEATRKLIDYLDNRMLGGTMPDDYKEVLFSHVKLIALHDKPGKANAIMRTLIRAITTSSLYMVIK